MFKKKGGGNYPRIPESSKISVLGKTLHLPRAGYHLSRTSCDIFSDVGHGLKTSLLRGRAISPLVAGIVGAVVVVLEYMALGQASLLTLRVVRPNIVQLKAP